MTATKTIARTTAVLALTSDDTAPKFAGANMMARRNAFYGIAPNSYSEGMSRASGLANFALAIGAAPKGYDVAKPDTSIKTHLAFSTTLHAAKTEWIAGRATSRMPASEFPKDCGDAIAKIDYVRALICAYTSPDAKRIAPSQSGKRSVIQHKVIRAAEQAASVFLAELNLSTAAKQSETDKKKRSTRATAKRGNVSESEALEIGAKLKTVEDVCRVVETAASTLLALANKHAKLLPTDYGQAVQAFKTAINAAANARGERQAASAAK